MKFVVFGAEQRVGMVHRELILDLRAAARANGGSGDTRKVFDSLLTLIESGDRGLDVASGLLDRFAGSDQPGLNLDLATTPLQAPFPGRRLGLAGANSHAHVANFLTNSGTPTTPDEVYAKGRKKKGGGFWTVAPPVGTGAGIPIPRAADGVNALFDYEGEVAVALGRGGKRLTSGDWEQRIWGAVLVIDWSLRPTDDIERRMPFYGHKVFDSSTSLGPWISVGEVDPMNCHVQTRVNGELRQDFNSGEIIYSFGELLEQMSEDLTLLPGDLLSGGTGPGTAGDATPRDADGPGPLDLYLDPGDTVEVTAPELGLLQARVVAGD